MKFNLTSWKTSLAGLIAIVIAAVQGSQDTSFCCGAGSAFLDFKVQLAIVAGIGLMLAKDSNVTGGTTGQPSTPQALADARQMPAPGTPVVPPSVPPAPVPPSKS